MVLNNRIKLVPNQVQILFEILSAQESLLKRISSYDKEDAKQALSKVYPLDLPGLGIIIEAGKLNDFLDRRNTDSNV